MKETTDAAPRPASNPAPIVALAAATRFLQWGALGIIIPIANLLRLSKGLSLAELGFSVAAMSGTVVVLELPTGILADRIGRKRTYVASLAFALASCAALFRAEGFLAVSGAFMLYGVSRALASGSLEALLIDRYIEAKGQESLHRLMSIAGAAETAGIALGSLAGGALPMLWERLFPASNRYLGNVAAMTAVLAALLVLVLAAVAGDRGAAPSKPRLRSFIDDSLADIRSNVALKAIFASLIAWGFAFAAVETYWQPRVAQIIGPDGSTWLFGLLSTGYFAAALLGGLSSPLVLEKTKIDPWAMLIALRLLTAAFVVVMAAQGGAGGFAAFYLAMFYWNGMAGPPEATLLNRAIPSERRASMLSVASLAMQTGGLLGAAAFGLVVGRFSIGFAWVAAAIVFGASAALYLPAAKRASSPRS